MIFYLSPLHNHSIPERFAETRSEHKHIGKLPVFGFTCEKLLPGSRRSVFQQCLPCHTGTSYYIQGTSWSRDLSYPRPESRVFHGAHKAVSDIFPRRSSGSCLSRRVPSTRRDVFPPCRNCTNGRHGLRCPGCRVRRRSGGEYAPS